MIYLTDIQFYLHGERLVLKEACIVPFHQPLHLQHFVFKSPFALHTLTPKELQTVNYVQQRLDVLHWNEGTDAVCDFVNALPPKSIVICNAQEKCLYLQRLLP